MCTKINKRGIKVNKDETKILLGRGGCPAKNTKCKYLNRHDRCVFDSPDLYDHGIKFACASFK